MRDGAPMETAANGRYHLTNYGPTVMNSNGVAAKHRKYFEDVQRQTHTGMIAPDSCRRWHAAPRLYLCYFCPPFGVDLASGPLRPDHGLQPADLHVLVVSLDEHDVGLELQGWPNLSGS